MTRHDDFPYDRTPLVRPHHDAITIDPVSGRRVTCAALRDIAETCYRDAHRELRLVVGTPSYDRDQARRLIAPCHTRALCVARERGVPGAIGGRR
jgi:hypothetical protein